MGFSMSFSSNRHDSTGENQASRTAFPVETIGTPVALGVTEAAGRDGCAQEMQEEALTILAVSPEL